VTVFRTRAALLSSCLVVGLVAAGCGGNSSSTSGGAPANPCDAATPPPRPETMNLCLGGALHGTLSQVDPATTQCSALEPNDFDGSFYAPLDGVETKWEFSADKGAGTFDINTESVAITLNVSQASSEKNWSSVNAGGRSGTITINPDRSGTVNVTLPERNYDTGGDVPSAPALTVKGTFRCPTEVA
jgi:hypothetical protein